MFTTVNSLNSVNIVGRYTNDLCMLPIQPFYRLPISFVLKKKENLECFLLKVFFYSKLILVMQTTSSVTLTAIHF